MTQTQTQGQDRRPPRPPFAKRKFTLSFTPAQGVSSLAGIGILIAWAFVLGVLMGRGYEPEAHIPELARIMPKAEGNQPPAVIAPDVPRETATEEGNAILQPGDMGYRQTLKGGPARSAPPAQGTPPQEAPQAVPPPPPAEKLPTYDYVYQVAAYKAAAPCDALVVRLRKAGLNASTEKSASASGTKWYKTLVNFRGTPDDVDQLREKLGEFQLNTLLLRSKTPSPPQKTRP
jgi:hypothetical protein